MTSDPIDQEKLRAARKWATNTLNRGVLTPPLEHCDAAAELILSLQEPAPTMADIEWSDAEHHLAEAEHWSMGKVVMLWYGSSGKFIQYYIPGDIGRYIAAPSELTPTGRKMKLVPEWEGGPVLDRQPGTTEPVEDAVVEPRVLSCYSHYNGAKLGTVVEGDTSENAWVKSHHDYWRLIGIDSFGVEGRISGDMAGTPRTVIWEPGGGA